MEGTVRLPRYLDLSPSLLLFLDQNFQNQEDLLIASNLESELKKQCSDLDQCLTDLNHSLSTNLLAFASHSDRIGGLVGEIELKLSDLRSSACVSRPFTDAESSGRTEHILVEELPALAKEVARVETVRVYADELDPSSEYLAMSLENQMWDSLLAPKETALKLETLIGHVEDAVSSSMTGNLRKSPSAADLQETRLLAMKYLKQAEDILTSVARSRPRWTHLVMAVDNRVDRALAFLRPRAIADHRDLLSSLGWPPSLLDSSPTNPNPGKSPGLSNPLFLMQGDLKNQYCRSFLALCDLQELQIWRKSRQLEGHDREIALHQPLWAIEELVNPISLASQRHFSKWVEKPEFIFALVYKVTRDFIESMDDILQPLVDKAKLAGYSCREEWISAMVTSLLTYLAKEVFPVYINRLEEDGISGFPLQARVSWLHLVDLMISFDKRIQALIANSGVLIFVKEDENLQRISSMSVFCDRPDWLEIWAEIELRDALDKLKPEMESENAWKIKIEGAVVLSGPENHKAPVVSGTVLRHLSTIIDRCRQLPSILLRARFLRLAGAPILREFLNCSIRRCQEAEGLTALVDDDALIKVADSINAAHYCESLLKEWCEDLFFLEMGSIENNQTESLDKSFGNGESFEGSGSFILEEDIERFKEFRSEWVYKISTVILRGFDARCRDYVKNKKQWQERGQVGGGSKAFIDALDHLQGRILKLEGALNEIDFVGVWRGIASGVDQLVFSGVLMSNVKFHDGGVERFGIDMEVLFGVFGAWCLRPQGFFPKLSEGLWLLRVEGKEVKEGLSGGRERWLRENGLRYLSVAEAEKILKNRVFAG